MESIDLINIIILILLVWFVYKACNTKRGMTSPWAKSKRKIENMAPLDFGTYENTYPRGECRTGKFLERSDCEIGNCPLGSTVSDQQFCRIQCAQDPDPSERQACYDHCMKTLC